MADKKISQLNSATLPLAGSEQVAIVQNGETRQVTASNLTIEKDVVSEKSTVYSTVSGSLLYVDWSEYGHYDITINGNCAISQSNIPSAGQSQVITLNIIGDYALTLPVEWEIKNGGEYDGVNGSQIVVQSWDNGNFYTVIN